VIPREPPELLLRCYLPCDASAPRRIRRALGALDAIEPVRDDALLVASELVTNAVVHSGCEPSEEVEVVAELVPQGLRIAVTDVGRSGGTPVPKPNYPGPGGVGLRVVEALVRRWGTQREAGTRVWVELEL
jgi:anti-sigma regulatory factor (Ser/Thr protein kinase)